jgi:predicted nucleotidyltransferase
MLSKNLENLKKAAVEKAPARRSIKIAAVLAKALQEIGQDPVLVGGSAVEFYTEGGYATEDIDMVAPGGPQLWNLMQDLGFKRRGKDFIQEELKIYVEFPSDQIGPTERNDVLEIQGIALRIIAIEDLIVDRLCAYKFWKSEQDGLATLMLMETGRADALRLKERAREEDVEDVLQALQNLYQEIFRKKMTRTKATQKIKEMIQKK